MRSLESFTSGGELSYYRTPSGTEIDFIWTRGKAAVGIEVKASSRWRPEFSRALSDLQGSGILTTSYGVYLGETPLQDGPVRVLPIYACLRELSAGRVLAPSKRTATAQ